MAIGVGDRREVSRVRAGINSTTMGRLVRGNVDGDGQAGAVVIMMLVGENEPARMDDTGAKGEQPSEQQESCDFSDGGLAAKHLEQFD